MNATIRLIACRFFFDRAEAVIERILLRLEGLCSLCRKPSVQKLANRCAPDLAVIPSKFIHVHADKFAGELRVHVACVCQRISDGFVPMCENRSRCFRE